MKRFVMLRPLLKNNSRYLSCRDVVGLSKMRKQTENLMDTFIFDKAFYLQYILSPSHQSYTVNNNSIIILTFIDLEVQIKKS